MSQYKNKYLLVQRKSDRIPIKRIDVGHLNKKERNLEWDKLNSEFPQIEYITCLEESQTPLTVFDNTKPLYALKN